MSSRQRLRSLSQLFCLFGPDAQARDIKNGASAEAARREDVCMFGIAQPRVRAKEISFGISSDDKVTDLSVVFAARSAEAQTEAEVRSGYKYIGRVEMPVGEWNDVAPNPRQRDTELHARKAQHLREFDPVHRFVNMAVLPDGRRIKLDGHTRVYLWSRGEVIGPESVFVDVFACETATVVENLYSKFDSQAAVETGADKIAGAARRQGLEFKNGLLRSGRYGSAVKRLYMYSLKSWGQSWQDHNFIYAAVAHYKSELLLLDQVGPQAKRFPSGIIMAALATFKRRGAEALPFWTSYAEAAGTKDGVRMNAVQALAEAVADAKEGARGKSGDGGGAQQLGLLGKGILACEAYRSGQTYKAGKHGGIRSMKEDVLLEYLRYSKEG